MSKENFLSILLCCLFISCSSGNRERHQQMAQHIAKQEYSSALKVVNDKEFYKQTNHKLIKQLELGTVNYLNKNYCQALYYFNSAEKTADELYTVSISSKFKGFVLGGESDKYYGSNIDRSFIYFYKSLLNYKLFSLGQCEEYKEEQVDGKEKIIAEKKDMTSIEKNEYLQKARSNIMKWDSVLNSFKNESGNKNIYKSDLLEKVWGSFIFKENGSITDLSRANAMLNNSKIVFNNDYMLYSSFNSKYDKFNDNYSKEASKKLYITYTDRANEILRDIEKLKTKLNSNNLVLMVAESVVSPLRVAIIPVPFPIYMIPDKDIRSFASIIFIMKNGQYAFNVPMIVMNQELYNNELTAEIYDKQNNLVKKVKISMVEPISEMVYKEYKKDETSNHSKAVLALATKYVLAISSAYAIYKESDNVFVGLAALMGGIALIDTKGNSLDLRTWRSLPATIRFGADNLPAGEYKLLIRSNGTITTIPSPIEIQYLNKQATIKTMNNEIVYKTNFVIEDGKTTLLDMRIDPIGKKSVTDSLTVEATETFNYNQTNNNNKIANTNNTTLDNNKENSKTDNQTTNMDN